MMSSHQNDILLLFTWDGICHVPISGASYRKALHPYADPSSLDDLTSLCFNELVPGRRLERPVFALGERCISIMLPRHICGSGGIRTLLP